MKTPPSPQRISALLVAALISVFVVQACTHGKLRSVDLSWMSEVPQPINPPGATTNKEREKALKKALRGASDFSVMFKFKENGRKKCHKITPRNIDRTVECTPMEDKGARQTETGGDDEEHMSGIHVAQRVDFNTDAELTNFLNALGLEAK